MPETDNKSTNTARLSLGKRTALALYWNFIGRMGIMGGRWFESILLAWLLGATGYGVYRSAFSLMAFALPFTVLGLQAAIARFLPEIEASGKDSRPLLRKVLGFRAFVCGVVAAGMFLFAKSLARDQLHDDTLWPLVALAAMLVVVYGMRDMLYRILVARFEQKVLNGIQVAEIFIMLALAVSFIMLGLKETGALMGVLSGGIVAIALASWRILITQPEPGPMGQDQPTLTIRRMIAFSGSLYAYNLINMIIQKPLGGVLIPRLHSDIREAAFFDIAWMAAFFAVSISGKALAEGITLTIVSEAKETGDIERLRKIFLLLTEYMYILTFPAVAGLLVLGDDVLHLFFTDEIATGALMPMLVALPFMAYHKLGGLTANFLAALDKERLLAAGRLVTGIINIGLAIWLIPEHGALGMILALGIATSFAVTFEIILLQIYLRPQYPWAYLMKMILIAIAIGAGAWSVNTMLADFSVWLRLPPAVILGVLLYVLGLWLLKPISRENLKLAASLKLPARKWMLKLLMPKG